ncbi:hypothetical protein LZQ00_06690 [Sphingobacterium sp. SRCM116780]|uniref:hypothetical protein n=1 Tax=Sphingobacterium sp. SRCM116780 TaxID=2907623 RepID=UPI001F22833A|nr:hypothetical protein [Sphingobacterium sp. SRCM116780]UIR57500.1 hypothetical protein LZQ00_06690 [Sphingobacterium sp. SRCM116780]
MKKITIIVGVILVLLVSTVCIIYTVRKNKIDHQHVSKASTSLLSIAVDDLLIDNVSSLWSWDTKRSKEDSSAGQLVKELILDAGIAIPARIYLFSTTPQKTDFYGILTIDNYDDCFSFFADHYKSGLNFIDKKQGLIHVKINKQIYVLFNKNFLVYKISPQASSEFEDLQLLLEHPENWSQINALKGFEQTKSSKHIQYVQKDKSLIIEATVSKHKTEIEGEWRLAESLYSSMEVRKIDTNNQTLTFWNMLPLKEIPALSYLIRKYTGLDQESLQASYGNYFDLEIKPELIIQQDTVISYTYDDNFNAVEQKQIQNVHVPYLVHTWKYSKSLDEVLPDRMFYKFHKKQMNQYLVNSTSTILPKQVNQERTAYPFYCFIDFEKWPEPWMISPFTLLKDKKVKVCIHTELKNINVLSIKGYVTY